MRLPIAGYISADMNPRICRTLSIIFFQAGILSVLLSIFIWWYLRGETPEEIAHAERFGIFVGLWAPTLLILSNRFDRFADKANAVPGLSPEIADHEPEELQKPM